MELRTGYRSTELGLLPMEWQVEPLGKHASFRTGPFGSALHKSDYIRDGVPVINPMHIVDGDILPSDTVTITQEAARNLAEFRLQPGEIVIGRRGDMGRCAVVRKQHAGYLCGTGSMIVRPLDIQPDFLQRLLSSHQAITAIKSASVGTTMVNLNQGTLSGLKIPYPPKAEQRAIAATLSDVDALIGALDKLIAKKRDLKQAAMQQLLTGQTRLPGFEAEWIERPLNAVVESLEAGTSVRSVEAGDAAHDFYVLKTSAVSAGRFTVSERKLIDPADVGRAKCHVRRDTILISRMNTPELVGEIGHVDQDHPNVFLPDRLWSTRFCRDAEISVKWLGYLLASPPYRRALQSAATGTSGSMKNISKPAFLSLMAKFPIAKEQAAIAQVVSDMDTELTTLEARRDKTRSLKQGMMQELLTGRIRLAP